MSRYIDIEDIEEVIGESDNELRSAELSMKSIGNGLVGLR